MTKHKVRVKIEGMQNGELTVAGGNVIENLPKDVGVSDHAGDVELDAKNIAGKLTIAGGDILVFSQNVHVLLDELTSLLENRLAQQDEITALQETIATLKAQASQPIERRDGSRIRTLLTNLGAWINLASLAALQADKAHQLVEKVRILFS